MNFFVYIIQVLLIFLLVQCGNKHQQSVASSENQSLAVVSEEPDTLPPLQEGEVFYKGDKPFGDIIELKGKQVLGDTAIFRLGEQDFLIHDSALVLAPDIFEPVLVFKYPEIKFRCSLGQSGQGPNDCFHPKLIATKDSGVICYVIDDRNYKRFFQLTDDYQLKTIPSPYRLQEANSLDCYHQLDNHKFIASKISKGGKSIIEIEQIGDSLACRELYHLNLFKRQKHWAAYLGVLGINASKNRMVYAYNYYRTLKFMDLEGKRVRTISFKGEKGFDENTLRIADGLDYNVTYFGNVSSTDNNVYFSYTGMTPIDRYKETQKGIIYLYIEKYDWNGNPICKYKLDQKGYFRVDEQNKKLYLTSYQYDDPFFVYDLP